MSDRSPLILAIGGGKGGVGKSMVSSNIAVQYAQAGFRTLIIDLDIGAANLHTIFGIRHPEKSLRDYFAYPKTHLANFVIQTKIANLSIVASSGCGPELVNMRHLQKVKLKAHVRKLDFDIVILDLGAGSTLNIIDFFAMADLSLVVSAPEPTSVVNSYEFLKNLAFRALQRLFKDQEAILTSLKRDAREGSQTVAELVTHLKDHHPFACRSARAVLKALKIAVVFNQARYAKDAELGAKLFKICDEHLCLTPHLAGLIFYNEEVPASVLKMNPISVTNPQSVTTKRLKEIASQLLQLMQDDSTSIEEEVAHVFGEAQLDYTDNLLTQKRLYRKRSQAHEPNPSPL